VKIGGRKETVEIVGGDWRMLSVEQEKVARQA
jgi:hypothetical protein